MDQIITLEQAKIIAAKFAEFVTKQYNVKQVYLYGSYAKGIYDNDSDIDIAVVAEDFTGDLFEDTFSLMKVRRNVDYKIEPHPFTVEDFTVENPTAKEVMETGIRII